MALKMICSNWLVCGWMLTLLAGTGVAIFQRYAHPAWFTSLHNSFPDLRNVKWDSGWTGYASLRGRTDAEQIRIGRSHRGGINGTRRAEDDSGWSYARSR